MSSERASLLAHLDAERDHVLAAVEGLGEHDLTRTVRLLLETATHAGHLDIVREQIDGRQHLVVG